MVKAATKEKDVSGKKPEEQNASQDAKRKPLKTFRVEDCSASVWTRDVMVQGESKRFYSVTLERSFKDRDGSWKYTKSYDADDLGKLVSLCQQASDYLHGLQYPEPAK